MMPRPPQPPGPPQPPQPPPSSRNQFTDFRGGGERPTSPVPYNTSGMGMSMTSVSTSNNDEVVSRVQTLERMATLEKRYKCLVVTVVVLLVLAIASLGVAGFALTRSPTTTSNNQSSGSTSNANTANKPNAVTTTPTPATNSTVATTGPVGTSGAAVFTTQQIAEMDKRIIAVTKGGRGPTGPRGANGTCIGVYGLNETHQIGGYYGWTVQTSIPGRQPLADINAKVGDVLLFQGAGWNLGSARDNVILLPNLAAWTSCNMNYPASVMIAHWRDLATAPYGFYYKLSPQFSGKTLYFTSNRSQSGDFNCNRGLKVKVHVAPRLELPIRPDDAQAADSETVLRLRNTVAKISRLNILTQLQLEQRIRSEGHSGLTDIRGFGQGVQEYNDGGFSRGAIASIHNHADLLRTVGIGEIQGVLNGVEFQTRHNDYALRMPHRTSKIYGHTEEIPFPDVPPAVLNKATVAEQVTEMQAWFQAFKDQDWSTRDYRQYFKPILCYLEGTWIKVTEDLTDPFLSERHTLDAKTWKELHNKMRFLSNNGRKNLAENIAFLPNAVRDLLNDTWPVFANWEYRILCVPLKNDVETQRLRVSGDLQTQLRSRPITRQELEFSRAARFEMNPSTYNAKESNGYTPQTPGLVNAGNGKKKQISISWPTTQVNWDYMDYLMEQIPGKNNYGVNLTDALANNVAPAYHYFRKKGILNAGHYSRYYSVVDTDAMGVATHRRGYHDAYLWGARTTQDRVSEVTYTEDFYTNQNCKSNGCPTYEVQESAKWSYAIPMELIYLTPLTKWNPYNLTEHTDLSKVTANGRTGSCCDPVNGAAPCVASQKAYDGFHGRKAFFTPASFFGSGSETGGGDTVSAADSCVLDPKDPTKVLRTRASGHWIIFPSIGGGVGKIRQRYPIMPIHEMGSTSYRETKALQELTLPDNYDIVNTGYFGDSRDERFGFDVMITGGGHEHFMKITRNLLSGWKDSNGAYDTTGTRTIQLDSDERNGHKHTVQLARRLVNGVWEYIIKQCEYQGGAAPMNNACDDGHTAAERSL